MTATKDRLYLYDTRCATARRRRASTSRLRTSGASQPCSTSSASTTSKAVSRRKHDRHRILQRQPEFKRARFTAFGMIKRAGRSVSNDPGLQALLASKADSICLVAKSWDYHVRVALGISNDENLEAIAESVKAVVATGREAMLDCEHFFDGFKGNRDYALAVARTAYDAGARWIVLCDTNGGTLP